ncbi:MAG: WecB/TagA/CpsF family glycosyltransferase [Ignavibacteriota bacterium]
MKEFDVVHPDGIGVYLASKFLYGVNGLKERITGSDFYIELIQEGIKNSWSFYFFGDKEETLNRISVVNPQLTILGFSEGYNFITENILKNIENLKPDILIVGLGSVKQEKWITENKQSIHAKVIIAVGDGTKVFAGNKKRGPKLIQMIGFEWLIRLFFEPKRLWKRYLVGIPLFILRIIKYKLSKQQLENYD